MCNCGRRPAAAPPGGRGGPGPSVRMPTVRAAPAPAPAPPVRPSVRPRAAPRATAPAPSGIDTALWGPSLWTALHTAAQFADTTHHSGVWYQVIVAMRTVLPCPVCSAHYNAWISAHPVSIFPSGAPLQQALTTWLLALHNDVNVRNGKATWTLEQVAATYSDKETAKAAVETLRPYMPTAFLAHFDQLL